MSTTLIDAKYTWFPIKDNQDDPDEKPRFIKAGIRLRFTGGVEATYSIKHRTVSVSYPGTAKTYRSGTVITDPCGRVEYTDRARNAPLGLKEFARSYGPEFVTAVLTGITTVED